MDWKATLEEILAERRQKLGEPPSTDDFIALRANELSDDERRQLLEHASVDPEVARELFDVLRRPGGAQAQRRPEASGDESPADEDGVGERWQAFRERLVAEGDLPVKDAVPAPSRVGWLPLAAMFLLGIAASLLVGRLRDSGVPEPTAAPRVNLTIVELLPMSDDPSGVRGAAEVVTMTAEAGGLVLALAVPELTPSARRGPFTLELTRGDGTTATVGALNPGIGGVFMLDLPREDLTAGLHQLRLLDREGQQVARFQLDVELRQ